MKIRLAILLFFALQAKAQIDEPAIHSIPHLPSAIEFVENNGQWDDNIRFKSNLPGGDLYIENQKLIYVFYNQQDISRIHDLKHGIINTSDEGEIVVRGHRFDMEFLNSNPRVVYEGKRKRSNYHNFFLGNKSENWAGNVPAYLQAYGTDLWKGVDYRIYSEDTDLKYDFIVHPGASASQIQVELKHLEEIQLRHENLYLKTSVNELIDMKPIAYQKIGEQYELVACNYILDGNVVSYSFPNGYDKSTDLIIDPKLIFSSYSGSSRDNWGTTATYDKAGNLYAAGMLFNTVGSGSYPTTTGAFQTSSGTGFTDMGISKFSSDGSSLIYSTYLGGSGNDIPNSMVVSDDNQLVVLGTSSSTDFPFASGSYDSTFNRVGTTTRGIFPGGYITLAGSDIVLTKFTSSGASVVGSTYIGGTGFDGINTNSLKYNYGDELRGEVVIDGSGNCYVATTTESTNFPVTNASFHRGGTQEAVVFKIDSSLSNLVWSTYLGGSGFDAAYSIQIDGSGKAYVAGGTTSSNFPTTSGTINTGPLGGTDGFVTIFNNSGGTIFASTRLGTSSYDQAYFVQLDDSLDVYVAGQTEGNYPIAPTTVYKNAYSGQFIHRLSNNLTATGFSTVFGTGGTSSNTDVDISLSAFLINQCGHIYVAGWGGSINSNYGQASASTTTGLPVTTGAHKATTDGNDFYLIVLDKNADSLLYATFFGGNSANGEHNDGGTSRFDKKGIVYQAVCAGCGGNNSFPTYPSNVYGSTNGSNYCNLGVIKFDLSQIKANIGLDSVTKVCIPGLIQFVNNTDGGNKFFWDFGDGDTSNLFDPAHLYQDTGVFTVMLVVEDSLSCFETDTTYISVKGEAPPLARIDTVPVICPGDTVMLQAYGGIKYEWFPKTKISNDTVANPFVYPGQSTTYTVYVSDSCGSDTSNYFAVDSAFVTINIAPNNTSASGDDTLCKGSTTQLNATGGLTYLWTPSTFLSKNNVPNPVCSPSNSVYYTVIITDQFGCEWKHNVNIKVEDSADPVVGSHPDTVICLGDTIQLYAFGGSHYLWSPPQYISDSSLSQPFVYPPITTEFIVDIISKCFSTKDTVEVTVSDFQTMAMPDTFACEDIPLELWANPGETFVWSPAEPLDDASSSRPLANIQSPTTFYVLATDKYGCMSNDSVEIKLREKPPLSAGADQYIRSNSTKVAASGNGTFKWEPVDFVECTTCRETDVIVIAESVLFTVTLTDKFGCINKDNVLVSRVGDNLYVPNSFSPNSDSKNEVWKPIGNNIEAYDLYIFNRWGQVIFNSKRLEYGWDGTYKGDNAENGVYIWKINFIQNGEPIEKFGTLTLLR